jgi:hypothetical protein
MRARHEARLESFGHEQPCGSNVTGKTPNAVTEKDVGKLGKRSAKDD